MNNDSKITNICVTGGAGYIGTVLTSLLIDNEHEVTVLDNLYYKQNSLIGLCHHKTFNFIEGDANDEHLIKTITSKYDVMNLEYYYNIFYRFNFKKKILKIIKENLYNE